MRVGTIWRSEDRGCSRMCTIALTELFKCCMRIGFAKSSASANRVFHNRAADKAKLARV
jgi:hypothetical protein